MSTAKTYNTGVNTTQGGGAGPGTRECLKSAASKKLHLPCSPYLKKGSGLCYYGSLQAALCIHPSGINIFHITDFSLLDYSKNAADNFENFMLDVRAQYLRQGIVLETSLKPGFHEWG